MVLALSMLAGLILNFAFAPFEFWPAPFISLGSLFLLLNTSSWGRRVLIAFLFGLAFFLWLLNWSGSYVGWFPWVALALLQAGLFSLIGMFRYQKNLSGVIRFSSMFLLIEILRMKFPFGGFGWGRVGHTQTTNLGKIYPFLGVTGITLLVVAISALLVLQRYRVLFTIALLALPMFLINPSWNSKSQRAETFTLMAVQGGVDKLGLDFNERALGVLRRHIAATRDVAPGTQLVIWPENASDIDPEKNATAKLEIANLRKRIQVPLLIGAVERSALGPENTAILYRGKPEKGEETERYVKQDLAPFGEYMPFRSLAERLVPPAKRVVDFQPGTKPKIFTVDGASFASLICFEILDDDLVRNSTRGANFIINQTNNATFGQSPQAAQQLQIARARAAELDRDLIAVSTTGFTAAIDNKGRVIRKLAQFQSGSLAASVELREGPTPASALGSWFWGSLGALGGLASYLRRFNR
jgi:apolipoprotein N-acyltransferase